MEGEQNIIAETTDQKIIQDLLQFGFEEASIRKGLTYSKDKEIVAEIALKLTEDPNADLSMYEQKPKEPLELPGEMQEKRPKMLFIVNSSLKMGKGKICAQVGHAVLGAYLQIEEEAKYYERARQRLEEWTKHGQAKVVLKCEKEAEFKAIYKQLLEANIGLNLYMVVDAGHTQIPAGSKTVLAVGPAFAHQLDPITKHLKLL